MKKFRTQLVVMSSLLILSLSSYADSYLCSYTARISDADKHNSKGAAMAKNYSNATVASILRQDRANFYVFNKQDSEDESDCVFHSKTARANMQKSISLGSIPQYAKQAIVDDNPLIFVDVYSTHLDIKIIKSDYKPARSTIR